MEEPLEEARAWRRDLAGAGSQGIPRARCTVLGRLKESADLASASIGLAGWEERSAKGQWYLAALQSPETVALTTAPAALTMKTVSAYLRQFSVMC